MGENTTGSESKAKEEIPAVESREQPRRARGKAELVRSVIEKFEDKIGKNELKPTVGDFIRLLQLEKELEEDEQPKEIKVSWIEPGETGHASEK